MPLADTAVETETPAMPWPWEIVPWPYLVAAIVLAVIIVGLAKAAVEHNLPMTRRKPKVSLRWRATFRIHPGPGWATGWERWRKLGLPAARKVAQAARPGLSWWDRHRPFGWREYATVIGRTWGWIVQRRVVATSEDVVLTFAGPRRGKSAAAAARIIDAPGSVIATSIRDDAVKLTVGPRSERGDIYIWNPEGLGSYASTMRWNPVAGCEDAQVAIRRAGYMVEAQGNAGLSDGDFWSDQASVALGGLLHAAALAGYGMDDVYAWALGTDDTPVKVLRQAKQANSAQRDDVSNFLEAMPERTRSSVATTLRRTLQFMRDPAIAEMLSPRSTPEGEVSAPAWFDTDTFVTGAGKDTLYLISAGEDGTTAPLFSALVAEIAYTVRHGSAQMPGGRLDPPLDLELDEIANIAPVPIHRWASWMGGCGIRIRVYAQSWAQLYERFGQMANGLWSCASKVVVYGGTTEPELLDRVRRLAGTVEVRGKDQKHKTYNQKGERVTERTPTYQQIDVIPAHELRLDRHWAVVLSADADPALVSTPKAWKRRDVRRWKGRTPACVVDPVRREVPQVDPSLRRRLEQQDQVGEQVRPLRAVATGTEGVADQTPPAGDGADRRSSAADEATQPMASMRDMSPLAAFVQRTRPEESEQPDGPALSERPTPLTRERDRSPRPRREGNPPLRRPEPMQQADAPVGGRRRPHPAPWDLPRSEPTPPGPENDEQQGPVEPPRAGRLPWDDWEQ